MLLYGPLENLNCLRFEAKHKQINGGAKVTTSRLNAPYTLSVKHQLQVCHMFVKENGFEKRVEAGNFVYFNVYFNIFCIVTYDAPLGVAPARTYLYLDIFTPPPLHHIRLPNWRTSSSVATLRGRATTESKGVALRRETVVNHRGRWTQNAGFRVQGAPPPPSNGFIFFYLV